MISISKQEIRRRVRLLLDEVGLNDSELVADTDSDDSELDVIIDGKSEEALRYVYLNADGSLVPWVHFESGINSGGDSSSGETTSQESADETEESTTEAEEPTVEPEEPVVEPVIVRADTGYVAPYIVARIIFAPDAVWRWANAGFSSWGRLFSPDDVIELSSPRAALLRDRFSTGTWERPSAAIRRSSAGRGESNELLLFSAKGDVDKVMIDYVAKPTFSGDALSVGERVEDAFIYYLSGLVCMTLGDERQQGFFQQATELMGKTKENN